MKYRCTVGHVYIGDARHVPNLRGGTYLTHETALAAALAMVDRWIRATDAPPPSVDVQEWSDRDARLCNPGPPVLTLHCRADGEMIAETPGMLGGRVLL